MIPGPYGDSLLAFLVAAVLTAVAMPIVIRLAKRRGAIDEPDRDDRRVHKEPVPRWGGIGIAFGASVATIVVALLHKENIPTTANPNHLWVIVSVCCVLVVVGAIDDMVQFSAKLQLGLLLLAGVIVQVVPELRISTIGFFNSGLAPWTGIPVVISVLLTTFYFFVVTKTMDTIDGIDGLAGGLALISSVVLCGIATNNGIVYSAIASAAIGGACLAYLRWNYHPAKIIMGTGGAYFLGFALAGLSITGAVGPMPKLALIIPWLLFGVPMFDALSVIIKRIRAGVPIYTADKRHTHHLLLAKGLNQRQAVWTLYGVAAIFCTILLILMVNLNG